MFDDGFDVTRMALLEKLSTNLASAEGPQWLSAFARFLRGENPWLVWKTVRIDDPESIRRLLKELFYNGLRIEDWARAVLNEASRDQKVMELEFAVTSLAALGVPEVGGSGVELLSRAISIDLSLPKQETESTPEPAPSGSPPPSTTGKVIVDHEVAVTVVLPRKGAVPPERPVFRTASEMVRTLSWKTPQGDQYLLDADFGKNGRWLYVFGSDVSLGNHGAHNAVRVFLRNKRQT